MSVLAPNFWPLFWTLVSLGAVATAALTFLIAVIAGPLASRRRQPKPPQAPPPQTPEPVAGPAAETNRPAGRPSVLV